MKKYAIFGSLSGKVVIAVILGLFLILLLLVINDHDFKELSSTKVNPDVTFMGEDIEKMSEEEVTECVKQVSRKMYRNPVDASIDPVTEGVIPELYGCQVDIAATVQKILSASQGDIVDPVLNEILPQYTIENFPEAPLYQGNSAKKQVSFLVNVAWGEQHIQEMLGIMEEHNIKSTFFFIGKWAGKNPDLVKEIVSRGHEAANHGYRDTVLMSRLSAEEIKADICKTNNLIKEITGDEVKFFSSHCGELNEDILRTTAELNMRTIMWSLDTVDWKLPGAEKMAEKILNGAHNGATVLMHPTEQTQEALIIIIKGLKEQGYDIVTLSELINPCYWSYENL